MSKAFGAAGLRLGYLAADSALVDALRIVRLPYHLSAVTQAAALAALSHREELMAQVVSLRNERDAFVDWLRAQGLTAHDSDANFVLFGPFPDRDTVWRRLLDAGVLIRVVGPEASCGPASAHPPRWSASAEPWSQPSADDEDAGSDHRLGPVGLLSIEIPMNHAAEKRDTRC